MFTRRFHFVFTAASRRRRQSLMGKHCLCLDRSASSCGGDHETNDCYVTDCFDQIAGGENINAVLKQTY